jgi:hypothetical protein
LNTVIAVPSQSVLIRVHPWSSSFGCSPAALRRIAEFALVSGRGWGYGSGQLLTNNL